MNEQAERDSTSSGAEPPGRSGSAAPGWYTVDDDATTQRYWDGHEWTHGFRGQPASTSGLVVAGVLAALAFTIGGLMMVTTQAASSDSIFEPLINGLGWTSLGAAGATVMVMLRR